MIVPIAYFAIPVMAIGLGPLQEWLRATAFAQTTLPRHDPT
jgi:hypothetical protein